MSRAVRSPGHTGWPTARPRRGRRGQVVLCLADPARDSRRQP